MPRALEALQQIARRLEHRARSHRQPSRREADAAREQHNLVTVNLAIPAVFLSLTQKGINGLFDAYSPRIEGPNRPKNPIPLMCPTTSGRS